MKAKNLILSLATTATVVLCGSIVYAQQQASSADRAIDCLSNTQTDFISNNSKSTIKNTSGKAEIGLAQHLKKIKAKMYGAFWCPYCTRQKELFGRQATTRITYIECDPRGQNARPDLCRTAGVRGYPTWEINGKMYSGMRSLTDLANISAYKGPRNFKNKL
jgi:glutaredoxin